MKNKLNLLFISFISLLLLTGCATQKEYITKYETIYVVLEPPTDLYKSVKRIKPPNKKEYIESSCQRKEELIFKYVDQLNDQIDNLLLDRTSINKWVDKEKELIKKRETK